VISSALAGIGTIFIVVIDCTTTPIGGSNTRNREDWISAQR
jgi:hypothetical protein